MQLPKLSALLLGLSLSLPVLALDLPAAMQALPAAKAAGQLGEQADGYLGVVKSGGDASAIAAQINQARRAEYQKIAAQNGLKLPDVERLAGQKAIERTPAGQFVQQAGRWQQK